MKKIIFLLVAIVLSGKIYGQTDHALTLADTTVRRFIGTEEDAVSVTKHQVMKGNGVFEYLVETWDNDYVYTNYPQETDGKLTAVVLKTGKDGKTKQIGAVPIPDKFAKSDNMHWIFRSAGDKIMGFLSKQDLDAFSESSGPYYQYFDKNNMSELSDLTLIPTKLPFEEPLIISSEDGSEFCIFEFFKSGELLNPLSNVFSGFRYCIFDSTMKIISEKSIVLNAPQNRLTNWSVIFDKQNNVYVMYCTKKSNSTGGSIMVPVNFNGSTSYEEDGLILLSIKKNGAEVKEIDCLNNKLIFTNASFSVRDENIYIIGLYNKSSGADKKNNALGFYVQKINTLTGVTIKEIYSEVNENLASALAPGKDWDYVYKNFCLIEPQCFLTENNGIYFKAEVVINGSSVLGDIVCYVPTDLSLMKQSFLPYKPSIASVGFKNMTQSIIYHDTLFVLFLDNLDSLNTKSSYAYGYSSSSSKENLGIVLACIPSDLTWSKQVVLKQKGMYFYSMPQFGPFGGSTDESGRVILQYMDKGSDNASSHFLYLQLK